MYATKCSNRPRCAARHQHRQPKPSPRPSPPLCRSHAMSHHHTYYVTSSFILCHIIIHHHSAEAMPQCQKRPTHMPKKNYPHAEKDLLTLLSVLTNTERGSTNTKCGHSVDIGPHFSCSQFVCVCVCVNERVGRRGEVPPNLGFRF